MVIIIPLHPSSFIVKYIKKKIESLGIIYKYFNSAKIDANLTVEIITHQIISLQCLELRIGEKVLHLYAPLPISNVCCAVEHVCLAGASRSVIRFGIEAVGPAPESTDDDVLTSAPMRLQSLEECRFKFDHHCLPAPTANNCVSGPLSRTLTAAARHHRGWARMQRVREKGLYGGGAKLWRSTWAHALISRCVILLSAGP